MPVVDPQQSLSALEELIAEADWPLPGDEDIHDALGIFAALYDSDIDQLKSYAGVPSNQPYVPDPLPTKLADASSNLIFGEEPDIEIAVEGDKEEAPDQDELNELVEENALPSELQRAASMCSAEGEVWWRILVDRSASDRPIIDWHSRATVIPLWRGRRLLACAFVSELESETDSKTEVWRYAELHAPTIVRRLLFVGRDTKVGSAMELGRHPSTETLEPEWRHNLDFMLAGRIPNRLGRNPRVGVSDYNGVLEMLFALNDSASIGRHNAFLTLRKRVVMPSGIARPDGTTPDEEATQRGARVELGDVYLVHPEDDEMGEGSSPMKVLEYSDTWAQAIGFYEERLVEKILTRVGVAPQLVGLHTENAVTGPALRARLMDSVQTANGKARYWDDSLPKILQAAALVDAMPEAQGGLGHQWSDPTVLPVVRRKSILPEDPLDRATRVVALKGSNIISEETSVREVFPEWDDERVDEELKRLSTQKQEGTLGQKQIRTERPPIEVGPDGQPVNGNQGFRPFGRPEEGNSTR